MASACLAAPGLVVAQGGTGQKRVLVLHFARRDTPAFAGVDDVFRKTLTGAFGDRVDYYSEYADLIRLPDARYQAALRTYLKTRYDDVRLDLVIAAAPALVTFLSQDASLFANVPRVVTLRPGLIPGPRSTGVVSAVDFRSTAVAALHLQPATQHVFVVSGSAAFDRFYRTLFHEQCDALLKAVTVEDVEPQSLSALDERLGALPPNSIVYYLNVSEDVAGHKYQSIDVLPRITRVANAPIYSWHESMLGQGIVGGRLHSSLDDAIATAHLAVRVMNGEDPDSIPVAEIDSHSYQFDWRQLQRWNIAEALLPAGSTIQFQESSFFERYRAYVIAGTTVFAVQLLLIAGLLIQRFRRQQAERSFRRSETRISAILRAVPDQMLVIDRNGCCVDYHGTEPTAIFAAAGPFVGRPIRQLMSPELTQRLTGALEEIWRTREPVVVNIDRQMDGRRHFEARLVHSDNAQILCIIRDITESVLAEALSRDLAGRLIVSQEVERQRIAREIHDDVGQRLSLLNIEVEQIAATAGSPRLSARLRNTLLRLGELTHDVQQISRDLHPSRLETLGLRQSLQLLCRDVTQQSGMRVIFAHDSVPETLPADVSLCLYRVTQEALHNAAAHGRAQAVDVRLTLAGQALLLQIADSGIGFDPLTVGQSGLGLASLRERVAYLDGRLTIISTPGEGTQIDVQLPLSLTVSDDRRRPAPPALGYREASTTRR